MATDPRYADFFGEISPEEEARQQAERDAAAGTPAARQAQALAAARNTAAQRAPYATENLVSASRQNLLNSGAKTSTAAPLQWGPAAKPVSVSAPNDLGGDLLRLGGAAARTLTNPINAVAGDYFPEPLQAAIGGPGYFVDAGIDEGLDQALPKGSGDYGANLIPGVAGTGGDRFYPSETVQSGSYGDGYRGVGNPSVRATPGGAGGAGGAAGGAGGAGAPGSGVQRPDQYRTDALDPQIQAMLDAERKGGPSEAEALLKKATDRVAARSLGIAAGARGGAGARERARGQALSANASLGATAAADTAALRAREANESKVRQQAIMALLQGNAAAGDVRDLGYEQTASSERSSKYNVDAADSRAAADRELTRAQFNAQQQPGLLDDPLSALFNYFTGRNLRSQQI